FSVDRETGALRFLNRQPSHGGSPCYVTVDATGKFVLAANYVGGNVSVFPVLEDGRLGEATDVKQYEGSGPNRERQEAPHAHCILLDPTNRYAYVCDLGTDRVMLYRFDAARGVLVPNEPAFVSLRPGAGPRQITFHPRRPFAYVINELDWTVTAFAQDPSHGTLKEIQTLPAHTGGSPATDTSADIHVTPDGRFVYASTRGPDILSAFSVNGRTGQLTFIGRESAGGKSPRNFAIDPTGAFLLAANQKSDSIVTFRIDHRTGRLENTGHVAEVPSPVCLKVLDAFS
ncbi:MAG TPA: lactonase family protein, partial [Pyrinomonadaceae bacterium]|nr:lactonase family protein [Pyrinomonadaceae bacterium]